MKLVWCPDTAFKAYIEAVRSLSGRDDLKDANEAEFVAALAGGWKAQLVVEAWTCGDSTATSVALAAAVKQTRGQRVIVVSDDCVASSNCSSSSSNTESEARVLIGGAEEAMRDMEGVDFMVVDMERRDAGRVMREAKAGPRGMVVVCKNAERRRGGIVLGKGTRVVRKAYLPIGGGIEILHVGVGKGPRLGGSGDGCSRWFKHVDRVTGEEHLFKK